ncbi:HNH endonuclease [Maioricimonas sp. JC845]|uniref:HNH endonuclease n=1 Tax=Maioricimonas sp. JC845 TaxID=3232138 RepID=UPI00345A87E8
MVSTSKKAVVDYWETRQDESGLGVDWSEALDRCWRCGYEARLERCHIVPASLGGLDEPSNLVLLCKRCHQEAPNFDDPKYMWIWIRAHATSMYDTYWSLRGADEFEKMFGRQPFKGLDESSIDPKTAKEAVASAMRLASFHFGQGRLNPATIACVLHRVEQELMSDS